MESETVDFLRKHQDCYHPKVLAGSVKHSRSTVKFLYWFGKIIYYSYTVYSVFQMLHIHSPWTLAIPHSGVRCLPVLGIE